VQRTATDPPGTHHETGARITLVQGDTARLAVQSGALPRNTYSLLISGVLACGAALRLWGLGFGLPHVLAHPDEVRVAHTAIGFLSGDLHPGFFNYPSLFMYALGLADFGYCTAQVAAAAFPSIAACAASWSTDWEPFLINGRLLSATAGTTTVALVYLLGRRAADPFTGLLGAIFLSVAFLHVRDSHFGVTDVAMTALTIGSLLLLVRAHDQTSGRAFAVAGLVAGLATSTKYNAALLVVPLIVSTTIAWWQRDRALWSRVPLFGAAATAGFLCGSPYVLFDPVRWWTDVSSEATHLTVGHGINLGVGWRYHFTVTLWHGLTWPLLLAGCAGALWIAVRSPRRAALLLAFPVAYYIVAGRGYTVFARYMVPVIPFLCLTAGYSAAHIARLIAIRVADSRAVVAVIAGLLVALPTIKSVQLDRVLSRADSRVLAAEWILRNVPEGSTVYLTGSHYGHPDLSRRDSPSPFDTPTFDERIQRFRTRSGAVIERPDWLIVQESPLIIYSRVPDIIRELLPHYELLQSFRAIDLQAWHIFDQQDALYIPLAGFQRVGRPGPNLFVYRLKD
jgi:hypothetical protein